MKDEASAINYVKERITQIRGKQVDRAELPLGLRKLKINTNGTMTSMKRISNIDTFVMPLSKAVSAL